MKTVLDINDIWDALEGRHRWSSAAAAKKDEAAAEKRRGEMHAKLKALSGGAG